MDKEYIIWGIPKGETSEVILYTKAQSPQEVTRVKSILINEHKTTAVRVQVIDFNSTLDFTSTII